MSTLFRILSHLQKNFIDLCVENLLKDRAHIDNLLKELLTLTMPESLILFDHEFYKQNNGVAMGSPL